MKAFKKIDKRKVKQGKIISVKHFHGKDGTPYTSGLLIIDGKDGMFELFDRGHLQKGPAMFDTSGEYITVYDGVEA